MAKEDAGVQGKRNMADWWAQFTPEQAIQKRKEMAIKRKATMEEKRRAKVALMGQVEALMPLAIANNLIAAEDPHWAPDQKTVDAVADLLKTGMGPDDVKRKIGISDKAWEKISKIIFHSLEPSIQDIGLQLYVAKLEAVKAANKMVRLLDKEIKSHRKNQKMAFLNSSTPWKRKQRPTTPSHLLVQMSKATMDKLSAENDYAKVLQMIGTHDKKNSAPTITIKTTIPRPGADPVIKEAVVTRRVSLEDAMKEFGK